MISFLLNDQLIKTDKPSGMALLDFIRYESGLKATKIGCREGDCGACVVLEGDFQQENLTYQTKTSCLYPLGKAHGKHIVTLEGLKVENINPVQKALVEHNGTQCGFCTPGFVMSLMSFLFSNDVMEKADAIESMDGNICRCTGYKSIERASKEITAFKKNYDGSHPINWLVANKYLPGYFTTIDDRLKSISPQLPGASNPNLIIAGGTDLMVQQADSIFEHDQGIILNSSISKEIKEKNGYIYIGAEVTATELIKSPVLRNQFPKLKSHLKLFASTPVRNMATLGGNIVNASPIGDLIIFFLALDAELQILNQKGKLRNVLLKYFFLDYKKKDLREGEFIDSIRFKRPNESSFFNFEKLSKRQYLDIASVNSAISISLKGDEIDNVFLSGGGLSPIPLFLKGTCDYLKGKILSVPTLTKANIILQDEISPISDIRGSADYKRLLARQLFFAHFVELFPDKVTFQQLIAKTQ